MKSNLDRLTELNNIAKLSEEIQDVSFYKEFRSLQSQVVDQYLPLLEKLASAGLLSVWKRDSGEVLNIESVCENSGFQFNLEEIEFTNPIFINN